MNIYNKMLILSLSMAICASSIASQEIAMNPAVKQENPTLFQKAKKGMQNHWNKYGSYYKYAAAGVAIFGGWACAAYLYNTKIVPVEEAVKAERIKVGREIALEIQKILDDHPAIDLGDLGAEKAIETAQENLGAPRIVTESIKKIETAEQPVKSTETTYNSVENQTTGKQSTSTKKIVKNYVESQKIANSTTFGDDIYRGLGYVKSMFVQICANTFKGINIARFR